MSDTKNWQKDDDQVKAAVGPQPWCCDCDFGLPNHVDYPVYYPPSLHSSTHLARSHPRPPGSGRPGKSNVQAPGGPGLAVCSDRGSRAEKVGHTAVYRCGGPSYPRTRMSGPGPFHTTKRGAKGGDRTKHGEKSEEGPEMGFNVSLGETCDP